MLAFERSRGKTSLYRRLPATAATAVTFAIVCLAWVFFRAPTLAVALGYLAALGGLAPTPPESALVGGLLYQPYYALTLVVAALVVWTAPQTWNFTRTLTPLRAAWCLVLLGVSVSLMASQTFNPFIYFIF